MLFFFFQAEDGIRDLVRSRGLGDVYKRQLYDNLKGVTNLNRTITPANVVADSPRDDTETAALALDDAIRAVKKADWRGNRFKEREVRNAIKAVLADDAIVDRIFEICLLYTSPSPRDRTRSRMTSSA